MDHLLCPKHFSKSFTYVYPHFMELESGAQRDVPCPGLHSEVAIMGSCKFLFYGHLPIQCLKLRKRLKEDHVMGIK